MSDITNIKESRVEPLYQLVYISRITSTGMSGSSTLNDIAETSIKNNQMKGITGIVCYGNGYFFQYVEGSEQALTNLKNTLLMDDRHKDMQLLDFSEIDVRRFSSWSLRSIVLERWMVKDAKAKALLPFKPFNWVDNEWQQFLAVLHRYYEEQKDAGDMDAQPIKYSALGVTLGKVVGEHQAFFLIQTVLGILIVLTLLWLVLSDKFL